MTVSDSPTPNSSDASPEFADVSPDALVQVGFVFRPHGIDGELKIDPEHTDDPARFEKLSTVFVGPHRRRVRKHLVSSVRYQQTKRGTTVILGLEDIDDRDAAEAVAKFKVFAIEEDLELGENELYVHDLVGMKVVTEAGTRLGTLANFKEMPAQDVLIIRTPEGEEVMIPAVEDFLLSIDEETDTVTVRPIEGLIE